MIASRSSKEGLVWQELKPGKKKFTTEGHNTTNKKIHGHIFLPSKNFK